MLDILKAFVDADKLGGWTRAGVAVAAGWAAAKFGGEFATLFQDPSFVEGLGAVVGGVAVAVWSTFAKKNTPPAA